MTKARQTFPWKVYAAVFVAIVVLALLPFLSVLASTLIADANGCVLNEASAHPCPVLGNDIGGLLAGMFILGWLMLATIPLGGGALIVLLIILLIHLLAWRRGQRTSS